MNRCARKMALPLVLACIMASYLSTTFTSTAGAAGDPKGPSVMLFIGDGMGVNHVELGRLVEYGPGGNSSILQLPHHHLIGTDNVDGITTDSAAAATAIATGYKTHNWMIGKNATGHPVPTILEIAEAQGYATGIVVTSPVNHATPAGFAAHNDDRNNYAQIAADMADAGIDLLLGGGRSTTYFGTQTANLQAAGYAYVTDRAGLAAIDALPALGLFKADYLALERDRTAASTEPSLKEMVAKAIDLLEATGKPFFLMVEGSQIDTASHTKDAVAVAHEVIEFEKAVAHAASIARINDGIQLIVCADHETGGLMVTPGTPSTPLPQESDPLETRIEKRTNRTNEMNVTFSTTLHTSTPVYLAGMGPFTDRIASATHLVDTFGIMLLAIDQDDEPGVDWMAVVSVVIVLAAFTALTAMILIKAKRIRGARPA